MSQCHIVTVALTLDGAYNWEAQKQLEATSTEDAQQNAEIEAEVKKANRDLSQVLANLEPQHSKLDILQKRYTDLLSEMKKTERDHVKAKKQFLQGLMRHSKVGN